MREDDPSVAGRYHGRPVSCLLRRQGEAEVEIAASAGRLFQIVPAREAVEASALYENVIDEADGSPGRVYRVLHRDCPEFEAWLNSPGLAEAIAALMPFKEIQGRERMLWMRFDYDRERFTVKSIRERLSLLLSLAQEIERRAAMAPEPPARPDQ
jgi:hypothetical protein